MCVLSVRFFSQQLYSQLLSLCLSGVSFSIDPFNFVIYARIIYNEIFVTGVYLHICFLSKPCTCSLFLLFLEKKFFVLQN